VSDKKQNLEVEINTAHNFDKDSNKSSAPSTKKDEQSNEVTIMENSKEDRSSAALELSNDQMSSGNSKDLAEFN